MPSPPRHRTTTSTSNIWLDHLPSPLCQQIATYLFSAPQRPPTTLLHLAESTPTQRDAVISVLSTSTVYFSTLDSLPPWSTREPPPVILQRRWASLLRGHISSLRIDGKCCRQMYLLPIICAERVSEAFLRAEDALMQSAALSKSLRALRLWIEPHLDTALLSHSLSTMRALNRLELFCGIVEERLCPFTEADWLNELGDVMGTLPLRQLRISCSCTPRKDRLWRLLHAAHTVTSVCVESTPPQHLMERVLRMEAVRVWNMRNAFEFVPMVAAVLRELNIDLPIGQGVSEHELMMLVECEHLEVLRLMLDGDVRKGVDLVVRAMPRLSSLKLRWLDELGVIGKRSLADVSAGMLLSAVRSASSLKELALIGVNVELSDMEHMLESLGDRLVHLDVTLEAQDEQPLRRLAVLLVAAIKWNHSLQFFRQARYLTDFTNFIDTDCVESRHVDVLLERLRQSAPQFSLDVYPHVM